ncbi:MAG: adenosine deaminase [Chloroflexaceae bacterium]|nr:adenosine deaminase [Chloroflexaceae bacterium]NJO04547.1 adenosine deaminase [Chloroflexaceae bacterium]
MLTPEIDAFIVRMPKVELHLHLEGSMSSQTLLELAERNNIELPAHNVAGVEQLLRYRHFSEFLTVYMALVRAVVHGEDFARLAYELGTDLAAQHVRYAEVMLSPMQHILRDVDIIEAVAGAAEGFARAHTETGIRVKLALDYGRQYGPDRAWKVLEQASAAMHHGVIAWSIGGNEIGHPPEPFAEVFAEARRIGLHLMAHAGEVVGPESVWGAVDALQVERVGHGIRSIDDPHLLHYLREKQTVIDVCPSSNLYTGAATSWQAHPLRQLYDYGLNVTVNSDDPTFFYTTITEEYRRIVMHFGFTVDELCHLTRNAVYGSFLPPYEKHTLWHEMEREIKRLRQELGV